MVYRRNVSFGSDTLDDGHCSKCQTLMTRTKMSLLMLMSSSMMTTMKKSVKRQDLVVVAKKTRSYRMSLNYK